MQTRRPDRFFPFRWPVFMLLLACLAGLPGWLPAADVELLSLTRIWAEANHNAFTDLIRFRDQWYCTFREGEAHVCPQSDIRVLRSKDGKKWNSVAVIEMTGYDLRDPKFSISPNGKALEIIAGATIREGTHPASMTKTLIARSLDGVVWKDVAFVAQEQEWIWRMTWYKSKAYGVSYDCHPDVRAQKAFTTTFYASNDGRNFEPQVIPLNSKPGVNESTLRFAKDDTAYCLMRRDGPGNLNNALFGISHPPYQEWEWKDVGRSIGGPNFIQIPDGRWIAAGRLLVSTDDGKLLPKTLLCELDVQTGQLSPLLELPSGGDNSYPGLVWHENKLWMSYYSSHELHTCIYLAQIRLTPKTK